MTAVDEMRIVVFINMQMVSIPIQLVTACYENVEP